MPNTANIERFETELQNTARPGTDKLLAYIRSTDFYTAPASTRYHMSCEGGLLQHSLNVLDALRGLLCEHWDGSLAYRVADRLMTTVPADSVAIMALLHDLCKADYYKAGTRNVKDPETGKWGQAPFYTVDDKCPLGHGAKSALIAQRYIALTDEELFAIVHHMGFSDKSADYGTLGKAIEMHPMVWALHTADAQATFFMEDGQ